MNKLTIKNLVIFAMVIGVIVGLSAAFAKNSVDNSPIAVANASADTPDQAGFFTGEFDEHDPTWLIEGALGGFQNLHNGSSNDPAALLALLEEQGIEVPEGAGTHELQNLLAGPGGSFDHSRQ